MRSRAAKALSPQLVRSMLSGHSVLGLAAAVLMYVLCVSGTVAVLYEELERWEQPTARESLDYTPEAVTRAARAALDAANPSVDPRPDHLYVSLPTPDNPRLIASFGEESWLADEDGELIGEARHDWTHFLLDLHIYLNLPATAGLTLVGILGVLLAALIVSGLLAHPRIFKDAFALRWTKSLRLQQVDLHNRLGVWGAPLHLAIALTGAVFGLSTVFGVTVGSALFGGDLEAVTTQIYGDEPLEDHTPAPLPDVGRALYSLRASGTAETPTYLTVHEPGTRGQHVTLDIEVPRRLVFWDTVSFAPDSTIAGKSGMADGALGKQVLASLYSLHFGSFGGLAVKIGYLLIGAALSVVTASGFNIWLIRRRQAGRPATTLERLWTATIWGVPFALAVSATLALTAGVPATPVFWCACAAVAACSAFTDDRQSLSRALRGVCAGALALVVTVHALEFGRAALSAAGLTVNVAIGAAALAIAASIPLGRRIAP